MTTAPVPKPPASAPEDSLLDAELARIVTLSIGDLRELWRERMSGPPPAALSKDLMARVLSYRLQEERLGGLDAHLVKRLAAIARGGPEPVRRLQIGTALVREHEGKLHEVVVTPDGFCWRGETFSSLSAIAKKITGVSWSGPRFFGLQGAGAKEAMAPSGVEARAKSESTPPRANKRGRPMVAPVRPAERAP